MRRHPAWRLANPLPYRVLVRAGVLHSPSLELLASCPRCRDDRMTGKDLVGGLTYVALIAVGAWLVALYLFGPGLLP